jgi:hypothetical protein
MILLSSATQTAKPAIDYVKTGDLSAAPDDFQAGFGKPGSLPEDVQVRDKANGGVGEVSETEVDFKQCDVSDLYPLTLDVSFPLSLIEFHAELFPLF